MKILIKRIKVKNDIVLQFIDGTEIEISSNFAKEIYINTDQVKFVIVKKPGVKNAKIQLKI